jgi:hypothetical protein
MRFCGEGVVFASACSKQANAEKREDLAPAFVFCFAKNPRTHQKQESFVHKTAVVPSQSSQKPSDYMTEQEPARAKDRSSS